MRTGVGDHDGGDLAGGAKCGVTGVLQVIRLSQHQQQHLACSVQGESRILDGQQTEARCESRMLPTAETGAFVGFSVGFLLGFFVGFLLVGFLDGFF